MIEANYDEVICPNCVTQFRAIPVNVQHQITALTAERDALKASNDSYITLANTAYELTEQRTAERDGLLALHTEQINYTVKIAAERDALKDAARLALDALEGVVDFDPDSKAQWSVSGGAYEAHECNSAINALKAVL